MIHFAISIQILVFVIFHSITIEVFILCTFKFLINI